MQISGKDLLNDAQLEDAAKLFAILSEPTRLRIIKFLMSGSKTVGEVVEELKMKQGSVSKQLAILREARLLSRERDGNHIWYTLSDPILKPLCRLVCNRIERVARQHAKAVGVRVK